jgi:hypothetical protein
MMLGKKRRSLAIASMAVSPWVKWQPQTAVVPSSIDLNLQFFFFSDTKSANRYQLEHRREKLRSRPRPLTLLALSPIRGDRLS